MENTLLIRNGNAEDEDWLFQLFRGTMQGYIDEAWGWDELLQDRDAIIAIEWASKIKIAIPHDHLSIEIEHIDLHTRKIN